MLWCSSTYVLHTERGGFMGKHIAHWATDMQSSDFYQRVVYVRCCTASMVQRKDQDAEYPGMLSQAPVWQGTGGPLHRRKTDSLLTVVLSSRAEQSSRSGRSGLTVYCTRFVHCTEFDSLRLQNPACGLKVAPEDMFSLLFTLLDRMLVIFSLNW